VERGRDFLGHRTVGEPDVALHAVERAAEDDLRQLQTSANSASSSLSRIDESVSQGSIVSYSLRPHRQPPRSRTRSRWKRNSSSSGTVQPKSPARSAMKPSTETLIE
jgi:hypothetical protein